MMMMMMMRDIDNLKRQTSVHLHLLLQMSLDPPIKQGQTRYHFLILLFSKDTETTLELTISEYHCPFHVLVTAFCWDFCFVVASSCFLAICSITVKTSGHNVMKFAIIVANVCDLYLDSDPLNISDCVLHVLVRWTVITNATKLSFASCIGVVLNLELRVMCCWRCFLQRRSGEQVRKQIDAWDVRSWVRDYQSDYEVARQQKDHSPRIVYWVSHSAHLFARIFVLSLSFLTGQVLPLLLLFLKQVSK